MDDSAEPASWMPGATPPQGLHRQPTGKSTRTALFVGLSSGLTVVLVAAAIAFGLHLRQEKPAAADPSPPAVATSVSAPATQSSGPSVFSVSGTVTLATGYTGTATCAGKGGYQDLHGGAQVSVLDSAGAVVALGQLLPGTVGATGCVFLFAVIDIPAGKGFYEVTVAHRGGVRYAETELATQTIDLSLGS